jgi:hypothetical protein
MKEKSRLEGVREVQEVKKSKRSRRSIRTRDGTVDPCPEGQVPIG